MVVCYAVAVFDRCVHMNVPFCGIVSRHRAQHRKTLDSSCACAMNSTGRFPQEHISTGALDWGDWDVMLERHPSVAGSSLPAKRWLCGRIGS